MGAAEWLRDYEADTENGKKNTVFCLYARRVSQIKSLQQYARACNAP